MVRHKVVDLVSGSSGGLSINGKGKGKGKVGKLQETDFRSDLRAHESGYGVDGQHKLEVSTEAIDHARWS